VTCGAAGDGHFINGIALLCSGFYSDYVAENPVPTVVAYGACDKVQPFLASKRLETALRESGADYQYFVMEHSGHGLQNDNRVYAAYMKTVEAYLEKYMG